jgi:hypothetical protein
MTRTGRPRIGTVSTIRLPDEHWTDLEERAHQLGIPRTELVRRYVAAGLREDARRYWEVPGGQAIGTIELYRGSAPDAEGIPLEEWLQDNSLGEAEWAWLRGQGLDVDSPEVWALYVPAGDGAFNTFFTCLPVGTHQRTTRGCISCGEPCPADEMCDTCAGSVA